MSNRRLTFSTYQSLHRRYKDLCLILEKTMSEQLSDIVERFLDQLIPIEELEESLLKYKSTIKEKENKDFKLAVLIDTKLYSTLKIRLKEINIRPATFFCYAMCYSIASTPMNPIYLDKAKKLLEENKKDIRHVVYGLKFYKPIIGKNGISGRILVTTEYFLDACSEQKYFDYYSQPNPFVEVLAIHRTSDIKQKL